MLNLKRVVCGISGMIYIPEELKERNERILVHISDTPICLYSQLKRLIKTIKPEFIIHTGDIVDNIKLELNPRAISTYEKHVEELAEIMESSTAEIIVALGNHDHCGIVKGYMKRSRIIEKSDNIEIEGLNFRISHFPEEILKAPDDYNLYGHDLSLRSGFVDGKLFFNGISNINIIGLDSRNSCFLKYPSGTDDARMGKGKIGL